MRYQDQIIEQTKHQVEEAFRYARATAPDKVDWKPLDSGRTVLDQAREMAKCPEWAYSIIIADGPPSFDEGSMAKERAEMQTWTTLDQCYEECQKRLTKLFELYAATSDDRLKETKWLPYDGGRDFTVAEMMDYPRWNFNWHAGQIAYIQTLYGDKDMH